MNKGSVTYVQVIGWGITLAVTVSGFLWTKIANTDAEVIDSKTKIATVEEAIKTLKEDNREIKSDIKLILGAVRK